MQYQRDLYAIREGGEMSAVVLRTLFVHTAGTRLVLEGSAVKALLGSAAPRRLPLTAVDSIVVCGGVDISDALLRRCAEDGRTIAYLSKYGKPVAIFQGAELNRGALRRKQYETHFDENMRSQFAENFVNGKLRQQAQALRQWARDANHADQQGLRLAADDLEGRCGGAEGVGRQAALGVEGAATKLYFSKFELVSRAFPWQGRSRRPPRDPVNATMSFLYAMTKIAVHGAVHATGLDPFAGFLHGDRSDQPSLVLDLMEEFRPAADKLTITLLNKRILSKKHFETGISGACSLNDVGRTVLMQSWHEHRCEKVKVRGAKEPILRAALPGAQAASLANALRSGTMYKPHALVVK